MNWSYVVERNTEEFPEKEALIFEDRRITFRGLRERVNALARGLLDLGLGKGDIVAILLYNCLEYIEITFAANKIGAIWLPLNFRLVGEELAYIISDAGAKVLISEADFHETLTNIKDKLPMIKAYIGVGEAMPASWKSYNEIIKKDLGSEVPEVQVELDDLERLMYTSGTTAYPKGVMITYGNLYWKNVGHIIKLNLSRDDKCLCVGPLYHVGGMDLPATGVLQMGGASLF